MTNELKLARCGCGGEAIIYINGARQAKIYCEKCGIESNVFSTKYEAITAWNRAMGVDKVDELMEHIWRDKLDTREKIANLVGRMLR